MTPQDKRYQEYREACAKVDGFSKIKYDAERCDWFATYGKVGDRYYMPKWLLPTYLDDASIDAVVRKLDNFMFSKYVSKLIRLHIVGGQVAGNYRPEEQAFKASPEQKAEALARTIMGER